MTAREGRRYASPNAFRRAMESRLKSEARARGRQPQQLRREFVFQRFLGRVFSDSDGRWVLKGGTGLLVRLLGAARFSRDIDLLYPSPGINVDDVVGELRAPGG